MQNIENKLGGEISIALLVLPYFSKYTATLPKLGALRSVGLRLMPQRLGTAPYRTGLSTTTKAVTPLLSKYRYFWTRWSLMRADIPSHNQGHLVLLQICAWLSGTQGRMWRSDNDAYKSVKISSALPFYFEPSAGQQPPIFVLGNNPSFTFTHRGSLHPSTTAPTSGSFLTKSPTPTIFYVRLTGVLIRSWVLLLQLWLRLQRWCYLHHSCSNVSGRCDALHLLVRDKQIEVLEIVSRLEL